MWWPFSKKAKDIAELPAISSEDLQWGVAEAGYEGAPLIIRFNESAKEWAGHPELPIKLGLAVPLNSPNEGGLPDPEENEQLNEIEEIILREVEARTKGVHALVLTTGVMKEFVFYVPRDLDFPDLHQAIQAAVRTHEVQCIGEHEPDWESYRQFSPA
jgi:hypothetical protein